MGFWRRNQTQNSLQEPTPIVLILSFLDHDLLLAQTGFFPIRAMTFRADLWFLVRIAWNPFMGTSGTMEYCNFLLLFVHITSDISLITYVVKCFINYILLTVLTITVTIYNISQVTVIEFGK